MPQGFIGLCEPDFEVPRASGEGISAPLNPKTFGGRIRVNGCISRRYFRVLGESRRVLGYLYIL